MAESKASTSIRESIVRPGRVRSYIRREYGSKAFTGKDTIKPAYLNKAIAKAKKEKETSLERALVEAKTLKMVARRRMKG